MDAIQHNVTVVCTTHFSQFYVTNDPMAVTSHGCHTT